MVSISSLRDIIGSTLYVNVTYDDNILLTGKLEAIDAQGNLLLDNVKEITMEDNSKTVLHQRMLGLVSVPRDSIVSIKINKTMFQKRQASRLNILNDVI